MPPARGARGDPVALTHLIATEHSWAEPARRLAAVHSAPAAVAYPLRVRTGRRPRWRAGSGPLTSSIFRSSLTTLTPPASASCSAMRAGRSLRRAWRSASASAVAGFRALGDPSGPLATGPRSLPPSRATQVLGKTSRIEVDRLADQAGLLDAESRQLRARAFHHQRRLTSQDRHKIRVDAAAAVEPGLPQTRKGTPCLNRNSYRRGVRGALIASALATATLGWRARLRPRR